MSPADGLLLIGALNDRTGKMTLGCRCIMPFDEVLLGGVLGRVVSFPFRPAMPEDFVRLGVALPFVLDRLGVVLVQDITPLLPDLRNRSFW